MKTHRKTILATAVLGAALTQHSTSAFAQGPVLEEVIVTATKRAEGMQDVPIALSVMSVLPSDAGGVPRSSSWRWYIWSAISC